MLTAGRLRRPSQTPVGRAETAMGMGLRPAGAGLRLWLVCRGQAGGWMGAGGLGGMGWQLGFFGPS